MERKQAWKVYIYGVKIGIKREYIERKNINKVKIYIEEKIYRERIYFKVKTQSLVET